MHLVLHLILRRWVPGGERVNTSSLIPPGVDCEPILRVLRFRSWLTLNATLVSMPLPFRSLLTACLTGVGLHHGEAEEGFVLPGRGERRLPVRERVPGRISTQNPIPYSVGPIPCARGLAYLASYRPAGHTASKSDTRRGFRV